MKKLSAALVLLALSVGAQMAMAADNPTPSTAFRSGGKSLTINGIPAQEGSSSEASQTNSYEYNNTVTSASSSSSSSAPQPVNGQKVKTKSNIKND